VTPEKGPVNQIQDSNTEGCADEQEVKSDVLCIKSANSSVCRESESDIQTDLTELSSKDHSLKIKDTTSVAVNEILEATNLNKNSESVEPKNVACNVAKGISEDVAFTPFPSVSAGEGSTSSPRSPHLPPHSSLFANNIEQVHVISSSANKCVLDSLEISDSVSCAGNKIGPRANSCDFTHQIAECSGDVSVGESGNFVRKSDSDFQIFGTVSAKTTSESVLNKDHVSKSSLNSLFDDISDQSGDSVALSVTDTSVCIELGSKLSIVGASDHVQPISETKSVGCKLAVPSSIGFECSLVAGTPSSIVDSSEPPVAGTSCPLTASSETLLAGTPASHGMNFASTLHISESLGAESECFLPGISDSLKAYSDVLQPEAPDCLENNSLTKTESCGMASECVKEGPECDLTTISVATEEICDTLLSMDCTGKISETSGHLATNSKSSPGETFSDYTETNSKPPPNSLEEISGTVLAKMSDFVEANSKSSLGKISDYVTPVIYDTNDSVTSSLSVILNSSESSLDQSSNPKSSLVKTSKLSEESSTLPLNDSSNFTEEISEHLLPDDLDVVKESGKLSSNSAEECVKSALADTLHSIEQTSLSLVDTPDSVEEDISDLSPIERSNTIEEMSNPSQIEISNAMEVCSEQRFCEPRDAEESSKLASDVAAGEEGRCEPPLVDTSSTTDESSGSVQVVSDRPLLGTKRFEMSLTESMDSLEESLKTELTSDSLEENFQSPLIESSEDISQPLLTDSVDSVVENSKSASTEGSDSMEDLLKTSSMEISDIIMENSESTEISKSAVENSKSILTESSDIMEENSESLSVAISDSVEENPESLDSVEEGSESVSLKSFDSVKEDHKPAPTESSDSLVANYEAVVTEGSELMGENISNILNENLEFVAENPQCLLPENVCSMETGSKQLSHETSGIIDICSDAVPESSDAIKAESKPPLTVAQDGCELVSSRILRSNSAPLTKTFDPTEENDSIPLHQRLLQSKHETAINSQAAGSSRVLRRSSALSVAKPVEPVTDSNDHPKGDSDRVLRSSAALKSDEPTVEQQVTGDMDSGPSKTRSKTNTAATRRTRLRKFSRRVRGEQMQEERHMDPETLFYCRIAGNIRENLLHHLDGKLEHEVSAVSQDLNKAGLSQPHTSVTATNEEKHNHHHHHKAPWEKFNFPKNYDGRCGEGALCLASYIKDMSHLDISTQLTMRQNLKRLSATSATSRSSADMSVEFSKDDVIGFSRGLCLSAKVCADRRRSLRSASNRGRDALAAAPGGAASTFTARYKNCSLIFPHTAQHFRAVTDPKSPQFRQSFDLSA
jgi:hypothetical protein